jgi:FMN reductase (NADPH)
MNDVIQTIMNHRSIRSFQDKALSDEHIQTLIESAQAASTSSFVQAYTIIGIKDPLRKAKLARISGNQSHVITNGHFLVFCLDLHRHELSTEMEGLNPSDLQQALESTEMFMVGVIDAALAAQNTSIAAESLGLGICYIGGLRNNLDDVSALLKTPNRVIPLFGLSIGYPTKINDQKQRLPLANIYHEEEYISDDELLKSQLKQYNADISAYYAKRTNGSRAERWTEGIASKLKDTKRLYLKQFLESKQLPLN